MSYTTLGKIGRTYGIKGWFHVISFAEEAESLFKYNTWYLKDRNDWQAFELEAHRAHGKAFIAKFEGYNTPEATRLLTNRELGVLSTELPELAENEYYWSELLGLDVYTSDQVYLGKVTQLMATGANDVLCVLGERERLIPYIGGVIAEVDKTQNRITVNWDPAF